MTTSEFISNGTYSRLVDQAAGLEAQAREIRESAERGALTAASTGGLASWRGYTFESSSGLTPAFAAFAAAARKHIKALDGFTMVAFSRGHFECSAFLKANDTGKLVYISMPDVRYHQDGWYSCILIRTAKHEKDYTGGANSYCTLPELERRAKALTA